jgi:hypothetical protein
MTCGDIFLDKVNDLYYSLEKNIFGCKRETTRSIDNALSLVSRLMMLVFEMEDEEKKKNKYIGKTWSFIFLIV